MTEDIHDFEITAICAVSRDSFAITVKNPQDMSLYEMRFERVMQLHVEGFSLQNVVSDVGLYRSPAEGFGFKRACSMLGMDKALECGTDEGQCLLLMEASSGAEIACLFEGDAIPQLIPVTSDCRKTK